MRLKIHFLFILLYTFHWMQAQNLLLNPGFENNANWSIINAAGATVTIINTGVHSGASCLKIGINNTTQVTAGVNQSVTVQPLKSYLLEYFVKTENLVGNVFPYFNFTNGNQVNYESGLVAVNGTTGWQKFQSRFTVPSGNTTGLTVFIFFQGTSGSAYYDDFSLTEIKDTTWSNFNVDMAGSLGSIKNFMGTNTGPKRNGTVDLTNNFQQTGINYVRTHDYYGPCDISTIFRSSH
jgi:Carbohydrate binding domain